MNCKITYSPNFAKELKQLGKRYHSIKQDYENLLNELKENPLSGTALGKNLRKVRMSIASKGKGKSGGARIITYTVLFAKVEAEIKLLTIYDKSDKESLTDKELQNILKASGVL